MFIIFEDKFLYFREKHNEKELLRISNIYFFNYQN